MAGLDDRDRGFNRQAEVLFSKGKYQAVLRYETLRLEGNPCDVEQVALKELVQGLHANGYSQLRTQLIFRGGQYLGSQETWVEYPDPPSTPTDRLGLAGWIKRLFRKS